MSAYLGPLLHFQRFFIPALLVLAAWAIWRTVFKKDTAVGLALYLALVVVVDGFMNTGLFLPGLEKGSIRYSEICAVVLLLNRPAAGPHRPPRRTVQALLVVYFALLVVSVLRSDPLMTGLFEFRRVIVPQIVAFLVARRGLDSPQAYRRFFLSLTALVFIVGLFDFWDVFFDRWIIRSEELEKPIYAHNRQLGRFGSMFLNPNYLGAFVALVFPPMFVLALNERNVRARLWTWLTLLVLLFCLVETQSRGPLLAFSVCLMLLMVGPCGGISRTRRVGVFTLFAVVFILCMPGFFERATGRFSRLDEERVEGRSRETTWIYTMRMIGDHPLIGIGFGEPQFMRAMSDYGFEAEYRVEALDAPHNSYLQAAVYAGLPALGAFLFANFLLLARAGLASLRKSEDGTVPLIFGLSVGVVGFLASIFPDIQLFTANVAPVYWTLFALLLALVTRVPAAGAQPAPSMVPHASRVRPPVSWRPAVPGAAASPRLAPWPPGSASGPPERR